MKVTLELYVQVSTNTDEKTGKPWFTTYSNIEHIRMSVPYMAQCPCYKVFIEVEDPRPQLPTMETIGTHQVKIEELHL